MFAQLPAGQISFHYEMKDWDLFNIPEYEKMPPFDGHTAQEALIRMENYLRSNVNRK